MWLNALVVPLAIGLTIALLRRFFPALAPDPTEAPLTDEERRLYSRWVLAIYLITFPLFVALLGIGWYFLLKGGDRLVNHETSNTLFLIRPSEAYWMLSPLFLGIVSAVVPLQLLFRVLFRKRFSRFELFCTEREGIDAKPVMLGLVVLVSVGAMIHFVAGATSFARFTDIGVEINRPFSSRSKFREYSHVRSIDHRATTKAANGNTIQRPYYLIFFDDGESWSTDGGLRNAVPDEDGPIAALVSRRSGCSIVERP
jgi:hypothetical protein